LIALLGFFCSCVVPLSLDEFYDSPEVKDKIKRDRVTLFNNTDDHLIVGNGIVTGLITSKYYMVQVKAMDENGVPDPDPSKSGYRYVNEKGILVNDVLDINKTLAGKITGLNNNYEYTVWDAKALTGSYKRYDIRGVTDFDKTPPPVSTSITPANGVISSSSPNNFHYIDITSLIKSINKYKTLRIPVSVKEPRTLIQLQTHSIQTYIQLSRAYKTTDYLLFEYDTTDKFLGFRFFTINLTGALLPDGLSFIVQYSQQSVNSPVISAQASTHNQDDTTLTFSVTNNTDFDTFKWFVDGLEDILQSSDTFTMDFSNINYKIAGVYRITVIAHHINDDAWYSQTATVTVTANP